MAGAAGQTITASVADDGAAAGERWEPALFLVVECARPRVGSLRVGLAGVDEVVLGRGARRTALRDARTLRIDVPDERMSGEHARLDRSFARWVISDVGSKNGTFVNGERVTRATLHDGDVLELGHTFFVLRESLGLDEPGAVVASEALAPPAPGLATLLPEVARELDRAVKIAATRVPVVLLGESGTGKEVVARAIHALSGRAGRLVAVNCGAIAANLVESELFGSRRGAFSGAEDRVGHVRTADRGTLLLDEIGDLPPPAQAALLRVLQEGEVVPVGESVPISVDVRVVAATHRDLAARVAAGEFRADLMARLAGLTVTLPPLRDRREDLGLLLAGLEPPVLSRDAARALLAHDWPLNIRELRNALEAARALAGGGSVGLEHLPEAVRRARLQPGDEAASDALSPEDRAVRDRLVELLREHRGNVAAVARALGKARPLVHRWLRRFRLDADAYRG